MTPQGGPSWRFQSRDDLLRARGANEGAPTVTQRRWLSVMAFMPGKQEMMVARDGIEPPTPAFSGPPTELAKWFGISGCH